MKLRKTIAVFAAALAVSAVTAAPISAQVIMPAQSDASLKTYSFDFDTLKSLMFKCGLDSDVNTDEENGIITITLKDGMTFGSLKIKAEDDLIAAGDGSMGEYIITVTADDDIANIAADTDDIIYTSASCTSVEITE